MSERVTDSPPIPSGASSLLAGSPFIVAVDLARVAIPAWLAALVGLAAPAMTARVLADAAVPALVLIHNGDDVIQTALRTGGLLAVALGPLWLMSALSIHLLERRAQRPAAAGAVASGAWGAALGASGFCGALGLTALLTTPTIGPGTAAPVSIALAAALTLFQTLAEEVFFRGWLQPILSARWGAVVGLVAASLLFAAAHASVQDISVLAFVNDALAGAVFGLLALRTGGLLAPVAAHFAWNFLEARVFGALPEQDRLGALYQVHVSGPGLWTGGADGFNGALSSTIVLIVCVAAARGVGPRWRVAARA